MSSVFMHGKRIRLFAAVCASLCLLIGMFFVSCAESAPGQDASDGSYLCRIGHDTVRVGQPIRVSLTGVLPEDARIAWFSDERYLCEGEAFVPSADEIETFLRVKVYDRGTGALLCSDEMYFSTLPVIYIRSEADKTEIDRTEYVDAELFIQGNAEYAVSYQSKIQMKGRGTKSWSVSDKKPYTVKFEKKIDLFGFGKNKTYALLSNYLDPTMLRNALAFDIGRELGLSASDCEWVIVLLNGEYQGLYQLCEKVKIGSNFIDIYDLEKKIEDRAEEWAKRISPEDAEAICAVLLEDLSWITSDVFTWKGVSYRGSDSFSSPLDTSYGYLFELTDNTKDPATFFTASGLSVTVSKPEHIDSNPQIYSYIQTLFADFEEAIASPDGYNRKGKHYSELCDVDSLAAFFLTNEIMGNEDAASRSRFCYLGENGKLTFGPPWDFDISSDAFNTYFPTRGFVSTGTVTGLFTKQDFLKEVLDDPYFQIRVMEKYRSLRPYLTYLLTVRLPAMAEKIYEAALKNEIVWTGEDETMTRTFSGPKGDLAILTKYLQERIEWLDSCFRDEQTAAKALHLLLSSNPYKQSSKIRFEVGGETVDTCVTLGAGEELSLSVRLPKDATATLYLNGLRYREWEGSETVSIPYSDCTREAGRAVLSVIAKAGSRTYTRYMTVFTAEPAPVVPPALLSDPCHGVHSLSTVTERASTDTQFGLVGCQYCTECQQYFSIGDDPHALEKSDVILPSRSCRTAGGIKERLLRIGLGAVLGLAALIVLTVFTVKKIRGRRARPQKSSSEPSVRVDAC